MKYYAEITVKVAYNTDKTGMDIISDKIFKAMREALNNSSFPEYKYIDVLEITPAIKS